MAHSVNAVRLFTPADVSANISDRLISPTDIIVGRQIPVWAKLLDTNYGDDYDL